MQQSGLQIDGQVRDMKLVRSGKDRLIAVARNNDQLVMIRALSVTGTTTPASKSPTKNASR